MSQHLCPSSSLVHSQAPKRRGSVYAALYRCSSPNPHGHAFQGEVFWKDAQAARHPQMNDNPALGSSSSRYLARRCTLSTGWSLNGRSLLKPASASVRCAPPHENGCTNEMRFYAAAAGFNFGNSGIASPGMNRCNQYGGKQIQKTPPERGFSLHQSENYLISLLCRSRAGEQLDRIFSVPVFRLSTFVLRSGIEVTSTSRRTSLIFSRIPLAMIYFL